MDDYVQGISADNRAYQVKDLDARFSRQYQSMLHKREHKNNRNAYQDSLVTDETTPRISVNALILFIENLLLGGGDTTQSNEFLGERDKKENYLAPWARSIYSDKNSYGVAPSQVVDAYAHASKTTKVQSNYIPPTKSMGAYWDDVRLTSLLDDVKVLRRARVQYLELDMQGDSFMQSTALAVERALSAL